MCTSQLLQIEMQMLVAAKRCELGKTQNIMAATNMLINGFLHYNYVEETSTPQGPETHNEVKT